MSYKSLRRRGGPTRETQETVRRWSSRQTQINPESIEPEAQSGQGGASENNEPTPAAPQKS